jgi:hypothetical protein
MGAGPVERDQEADDPLAIEDEEEHDSFSFYY